MPSEHEQPSTPGLAAEKLANAWMQSFMGGATLPLFVAHENGQMELLGSGVLFQGRGRYFLVTAQHVLGAHNPSKILLPRRDGVEVMSTIGKCHVTKPLDPTLDVAIIEFQMDETIAMLQKHANFVTARQMGLADPESSVYLCGYPAALMQPPAGKPIEGQQFLVRSRFLKSVGPNLLNPPVDGVEFFFHYARTGPTSTGEVIQTPKLEGVSGGGVWQARRKEGVWTSDSDLVLIGVQHSYKHGEFFRAFSWYMVHQCFKLRAPEVAQDIIEAIFPNGAPSNG